MTKRLLVCGCSFSSGWGFAGGREDSRIWPNQVSQKLGFEIDNLAETGIDNQGIMLNALAAMGTISYDLILIEMTALSRVILSPEPGSMTLLRETNDWPSLVSDQDYADFYKVFAVLNGDWLHWQRLCQAIRILQRQSDRVYFVNGLLDWNQHSFVNQYTWQDLHRNTWWNRVIAQQHLTDHQIQQCWSDVKQQYQDIDWQRWINPWHCLNDIKKDSISPTDQHPGIRSQDFFTKIIWQYLQRLTKNS